MSESRDPESPPELLPPTAPSPPRDALDVEAAPAPDVGPLDVSPLDVSPLDVSPLDVSPLDVSPRRRPRP